MVVGRDLANLLCMNNLSNHLATYYKRILVWSDKCQSKQEVGRSSADIDQTL